MGKGKKVMINLPSALLQEVDRYLQKNSSSRSQFFQEALRCYLQKQRRQDIREELRTGYREMEEINLELAQEGIHCDYRIMHFYEESLAECE